MWNVSTNKRVCSTKDAGKFSEFSEQYFQEKEIS